MSIRFIFISALILTTSCARPRYFEAQGSTAGNAQAENSCQSKTSQSGLCVSLKFNSVPNTTDSANFTLKISRMNAWDQSLVPTNFNNLKVRLWMSSMGHGSSPVTITVKDTGTYYVEDVYFIMPGDWQVQISDGANDNAVIDLQIL